jgi:transketolase
MHKESWRTFVLTGDGELNEGSNWEAAMTAQQYGLDNLVVIVDYNRIQQGDFTESHPHGSDGCKVDCLWICRYRSRWP